MVIENQEKVRSQSTTPLNCTSRPRWKRLGSHWTQLLAEFTGDCLRPVRQLSLMTGQERQEVLEQWAGRKRTTRTTSGKAASGSYCSQVTRHADGSGVDMGGRPDYVSGVRETSSGRWRDTCVTWVAPEERVSVCLEPGAELIVAILGAVSCGAAYVPLDPDYPQSG